MPSPFYHPHSTVTKAAAVAGFKRKHRPRAIASARAQQRVNQQLRYPGYGVTGGHRADDPGEHYDVPLEADAQVPPAGRRRMR